MAATAPPHPASVAPAAFAPLDDPAPPVQTVWETDAEGRNHYQSPAWYRYVGTEPGTSHGEDWLDFYHPDDVPRLDAEWRRARTSGGRHRYDVDARIRRHDGAYRWFRIQGVPVRDADGGIVQWTGTCTEVDAPRHGAAGRAVRRVARMGALVPGIGPLQRRLFLLVLLGLLPLALLSLATLVSNGERQQRQILAASEATMQALLTAVESELAMTAASLDVLASSPRLAAMDLAGFEREARELLARRPGWATIVLSTPDARQLMNLRLPPGAPAAGGVAPETMSAVARTGQPQVGDVRFGPAIQGWGFPVAVPVSRGGQVVQVLTAVLRPQALEPLVKAQRVPEGAVVGVFDRAHRIVTRSLNAQQAVGRPASPGLLALLQKDGLGGWGTSTTIEGRAVYSVFHRSARTGWSAATGIPAEILDGPVRRSMLILGGATVASVLAGLVAAALIARTVSRPVRELEDAARHVGLGLPPPVPHTDLPEIRQVGYALFTAHAEREKLLERERDAKAREQQARRAAEDTNRAKDEFLAMLGHELRNPLAAISTASQLLEREPRPEIARQALAIVRRQVQQLAKLTDDLMDAGRVVMGKIALERRPMDLAATVASAVETVRKGGHLAPHAVELALAPVWIDGDAGRIEQIVANLLVNACKYTPPPGQIAVTLRREGGQAVLGVRDSGMGLEPELKARVFDLFVQGGRAQAQSQGGLGIGLTLVRRLAELHGGSVEAHSEGPGRGSEFVVRLPAIEPADAPGPAEVASAPAVVPRTVVVVDDNADLRDALRRLLELDGHRVHEAADGPEGVRTVLEVAPDVALVDLGLPGIDGLEVARQIRQRTTQPVRLLAVTGYGHRDDLAAARAAGFDACLVKPVDPRALARLLASA